MTIDKAVDLLKVERECASRSCDRQCAKCDLVQEQKDVLDAYSTAIDFIERNKAKVLTLFEIDDYPEIYYESFGGNVFACFIADNSKGYMVKPLLYKPFTVNANKYGFSWRCWNRRPTEEERKKAEWKKTK